MEREKAMKIGMFIGGCLTWIVRGFLFGIGFGFSAILLKVSGAI